ncbi:MAG: linoleoyl-CoA desaturase [Dokdonia sp.]|jgi:linoleoyl-CoA desaturase
MKAKSIFPKEPDFFYKDVCKEVQDYFEANNINKHGNNSLVVKYLLIKVLLVFFYMLIFYFQNSYGVFALFVILGPLSIILAINISHDAIHGVAHSNKWINSYFTIQMDLIGANSYVWKKRHQFGHHIFPNTLGKDPDLTQTDIVKILPKATYRSYHRFQHIYMCHFCIRYTP